MILRTRLRDCRTLLAVGQLCCAVSVLASSAVTSGPLEGLVRELPSGDLLAGMVQGFSAVLLGVSIVINIRALYLCQARQRSRAPTHGS